MRLPRSTDHERGGTETWGFTAAAALPEWTGQPSASAQGLPGRRALRPLSQQNSHGPCCSFQMEECHLMHQSPGMAGRGWGLRNGRSAWMTGPWRKGPATQADAHPSVCPQAPRRT